MEGPTAHADGVFHTMGGDYGLVYPLWTDPHGPGTLLDRAIGEVGLDHLTVPTVTGPITQFRLDPANPPHTFVSEGGWQFHPHSACYTGSSIRPRPARWLGKRDVLAEVCDYARQRKLPVILRIALRAVTTLLEQEPHLRSRNAWGDELVSAGACVLNPVLRELLHDALEDALRYEPSGFQLVDWVPDLPRDHDRLRPLDWQPLARKLADICFCPACRQTANGAGIDAEQAARSVRVHVEQLLTHPADERLSAKVHTDELLNAYQQARRRDTAAWLQRLAETHHDRQRYFLSDLETCRLNTPGLAPGAFLILLRSSGVLRHVDEDALRAVSSALNMKCGLTLPVWRPQVVDAGQLVRVTSEAAKAGIAFLDFEGLEEAPADVTTWLRQAVRFARRG